MAKNDLISEIKWNERKDDLIEHMEEYHESFKNGNVFRGPSYHFHRRALDSKDDEKIEMVYAVLVSWGMHRMGSGGAKMKDYDEFQKSLKPLISQIESIKKIVSEKGATKQTFYDISDDLKTIYDKVDVMESGVKIVGNSKVLAHYLPEILSPIDRQYTLNFLTGNVNRTNFNEKLLSFEMFKTFHLEIVLNVINDSKFRKKANQWLKDPKNIWDTSLPKIVDNLIIGKITQEKIKIRKAKQAKK